MAIINGTNNNDTLLGTAEPDIMFGFAGNDFLNGRESGDIMQGGTGDDQYVVDNPSDQVIEFADAGIDLISSAIDYSLENLPNVENLFLIEGNGRQIRGNQFNNFLIGNNNDNRIDGLAGDDQMRGEGGSDYLDGGTGSDRMEGGTGTDVFIVDNAGDVVVENANEGDNDLVITSISYTLSANVERLALNAEVTTPIDGTGNELNNELFGNNSANVLKGLAGNDSLRGDGGNDTLDGGLGTDQLAGELGDDLYIINDAGDGITEAVNEGIDTVQAAISYQLSANVENLTLTGRDNLKGLGNDADNLMVGNAGVNTLNGGAGNDILFGGAGRDRMIGKTGADRFVLSAPQSGVDRIQDFDRREGDKLVVDFDDFKGLQLGNLRRSQFVKGTEAGDRNDRFIYNQRNGALFYDRDGSGSAAQVQIATFGGKPALAANSIIVVDSPF